ncbi:Pyruvate, water dikinase [Flagellimonas maritima]|uniref:Phosphoenolpyruvate synthase n=1 Tax=Flagellimonas maritima TaxID=1383885 RepID=A0A2Z4LST2_9FLAO|nr:PEP/pyruvate-binding domain-containing protein [Allomuricauda aurantiaca]AWX44750.1 Pyruvate, water dikinase [Allomuricauda aurantiaca]
MLGTLLSMFFLGVQSQEIPNSEITSLIQNFKKDLRGPYHRIRWFCKDGSIREPRDPCPDSIGGGIQHASYKPIVKELAEKNRVYLGEILAHTDKDKFWDAYNANDRLKQYQLGRYLASVDDGWILRKAQYYRGAVQSEDEEAWGVAFYKKLLKNDDNIKEFYYLIRQSLRDIPHDGDTNLAQDMRSQSKILAEDFPKFMDARIKIHGKPSVGDIEMVKSFLKKYQYELTGEQKKTALELIQTLEDFHAPIDFTKLKVQVLEMKGDAIFKDELYTSLEIMEKLQEPKNIIPQIADILCNIREKISEVKSSTNRLLLLDMSVELEDILLKKSQDWKPNTLKGLLEKIYTLSLASMGTGLIELEEWQALKGRLLLPDNISNLTIAELKDYLVAARSVVEWNAGMVKAVYANVVNDYIKFEPLAYGFIDDRIRSSVSLALGESVSELGNFLAQESSLTNKVMNINGQSAIRGLNPGYAKGELVVVEGNPEEVTVQNDKIYIFQKPPSDLKPVAGIMTVSEGNLVSHVQLLARNLGIPNAALSSDNLNALAKYNGKEVFYAVTASGNVVLKLSTAMNSEEHRLFANKQRNTNKITVPTDKIKIALNEVLDMRNVSASDSGKLCGPKAANLGQLKKMFPEQVVEGLVIPFGIFKDHMNQSMPGTNNSYWDFLNITFTKAETMRNSGTKEEDVEEFQLKQLKVLEDAIKKIELRPDFVKELQQKFGSVLGGTIGEVPVFLRSDTNMEDLEEFTGAGLNLTLFNVLSEEKILQGIKDVWASPYTERSFKWRQRYLLNPENVYPSILIIPSVDVDYSGVMITKGINLGTDDDITVAFSRGAGGAVDGQSAETHLITNYGHTLLSPSRQPDHIRLPESGGVKKHYETFDSLILNEKNIVDLRNMANDIRKILPAQTASTYKGAYDVELGFKKDKLWLFQIRPFVENTNAKTSEYLKSITPKIDFDKKIALNTSI